MNMDNTPNNKENEAPSEPQSEAQPNVQPETQNEDFPEPQNAPQSEPQAEEPSQSKATTQSGTELNGQNAGEVASQQQAAASQAQQTVQAPPPNLFSERSFAQNQGQRFGAPPQYGGNPYSNMYSPPVYGQPYVQSAWTQHPAPTVPPAVPADGESAKKPAKGWAIAMAVIVVIAVAAVMLLLAANHDKNDTGNGNLTGSSVNVTLPVKDKPQSEQSDYADEATGLFTTEGAVKYAEKSIVNLYTYSNTVIAASNSGSGIILSDDGYILTNAHVVADGTRFKARLSDGREFEAEIIGCDTNTDIAVLKIEAEDLTPADIGKSSQLNKGEQVIAIGNAGGYNDSVSVGNVSYVHREINSYTGYPITCVQTDACLNFGNSGGALINMYGQIVGMVTSKYSSTGAENIGFAIATDFAVPIVEDIISKGYVSGRPRVGIIYTHINAENAALLEVKPGLCIVSIDEACDIANTDLQVDDIITEIDGISMLTSSDVKDLLTTHAPGDVVTAKVYRKSITGEETEFEITFELMENKNTSSSALS